MANFYKVLMLSAALSLSPQIAAAQDTHDEIIVTGAMRASQGGAQDIKHFRGQASEGVIPSPHGMTSEGLLSEHDLYLTSGKTCDQVLCLNAATMPASITDGDYFAGLGFDTNISDDWTREPLNLIAVIDRSGSMRGDSIENVKHSLLSITENMREGDQISFVLYGSDVVTHLEPLGITKKTKNVVKKKIKSIVVEGSTNMDKGLALGYNLARQTQADFLGQTRVMIFTDERPNVGRTDAEGFMARANAASLDGIGLTTIGYGVNYGGALAAKIASVRGGNLFYVSDKDDVDQLFKDEFDFMVSELAHDLTVTLKPSLGLTVDNVYGVPEHMISRLSNGAVSMSIPTVFFSSQGGGLFVSLDGKQRDTAKPLFTADMQYKDGLLRQFETLKGNVSVDINSNLRKAEALSAQYTAIKHATETYYKYNREEAFEIFNAFAQKFEETKIAELEPEYELVSTLNEKFAFDANRMNDLTNPPEYARLHGLWEVTRAKNMLDVKKGDLMNFTSRQMKHFRKSVSLKRPDDTEAYLATDKQIYLKKSDLTFNYAVRKNGSLALRHRDGKTVIYLKPLNRHGGGNAEVLN